MEDSLCYKVIKLANKLRTQYPNLRRGQSLWIALEEIDAELAYLIQDTPEADPFYDDKNIQRFFQTI